MIRKAGKSISLLLFIVYIYLQIANRWFYLISFNFICISVLHESGLCPEWCSKNKIKLANANWSDCRIQISKLGSFGECFVWQLWYWFRSFIFGEGPYERKRLLTLGSLTPARYKNHWLAAYYILQHRFTSMSKLSRPSRVSLPAASRGKWWYTTLSRDIPRKSWGIITIFAVMHTGHHNCDYH